MGHDGDMDSTPPPGTWCLDGRYTEQDLRTFAAFLAKRVAGSKLWALGVFILMPLLWSGNLRHSWPLLAPVALVLIAFILLLRFVILPGKLYRASLKLPGVFAPRRITIDANEVANTSEAGGFTIPLEAVKEVVAGPGHLFVMVAPKQGFVIPRAWLGDGAQEREITARLLSKQIAKG